VSSAGRCAWSALEFGAQRQGFADSTAHPPLGPLGTSRLPAERKEPPHLALLLRARQHLALPFNGDPGCRDVDTPDSPRFPFLDARRGGPGNLLRVAIASAVPVRMTRGIASAFLMSVAALCGWLHCRQRLDPF
jgi:hypothetical protein